MEADGDPAEAIQGMAYQSMWPVGIPECLRLRNEPLSKGTCKALTNLLVNSATLTAFGGIRDGNDLFDPVRFWGVMSSSMMKYNADSDRHNMNFLLSLIITSLPARMTVSPWNVLFGVFIGDKRVRA